jgi:MobA/MobL family
MAAAVAPAPAGSFASGHYHFSVEGVGRGNGAPVMAKAAYRSGECLFDERTAQFHDYTGGAERVIHTYVMARDRAPAWMQHAAREARQRAWNEAERAEPRKNGRIATELVVGLPHELTDAERKNLLSAFVRRIVGKHGVFADVSMHLAHDDRNIHAHVLLSHRELGPDGFGEIANRRTITKKVKGQEKQVEIAGVAATPADIKKLREQWAHDVNRAYERAGLAIRVDHRSFEDRGIKEVPTIHLGPKAAAMERAGLASDRGDINRIIEFGNAELRRLEAEKQRQDAAIIDLQAKLAERMAHQAAAGRRDEITPATEQPKDQTMPAQEPRNENDAFKGAKEYMAACEAEYARQAEAAKGLPDPFQPPPPQNENERQALKMWLAELDKQLAERIKEGAPSFRPSTPQPGRYDELKSPAAANQNRREPQPSRDDEVKAAPQPAAQAQFRLDAINPDPWNAVPDLDFSAAAEAAQAPQAPSAPAAPEQTKGPTGEPQTAARAAFLDSIAERFSGFITYLSDLISPPRIPPEQVEDIVQRVNEAEEAARAEAFRGHVPGYDPEPPGRRDWRGIERPEPHADFARGRGIEDDLEPD